MLVILLTTICLWGVNGGYATPEPECEECCIPDVSDYSSCFKTCVQDCLSQASDCYDIANYGNNQTDVHTITPVDGVDMEVRCEMRYGGGWTVIQRRFDGSLRFNQNWEAYKKGFGTPAGEYWLGNENIYLLTNSKTYDLFIELTAHDLTVATARYESFRITDEQDNYRLILGRYLGGNAGNSLGYHSNMPFSTFDKDNIANSCYAINGGNGGWWYKSCDRANLNGVYRSTAVKDDSSIEWNKFRGTEALKASLMAIRPSDIP